jgi:peroxiredoxin
VQYLQPELRVNYCRMVTVSVGDRYDIDDLRESLSAEWPFLVDGDRSLLYELEMVDKTDYIHGDIFIPYTFVLDGDRTIYKIYNGWWFLGRPTVEEIRMDLRALFSKRPDVTYSSDYRRQRAQYNLPVPIPQPKTV